MAKKEDMTKVALARLQRVANQYARSEKLPIRVGGRTTISTREAHALQAIGEHSRMSVTDVAVHFGVTKSAASQLVSKLQRRGFLCKDRAPHSEKEWNLSLTERGWQAFQAHEAFHGADKEKLIRNLGKFTKDQIETLSTLLESISAVLDDRLDNP